MRDLTQGPEGKQILRFATPMLLGNVFQQLYNIINAVVVGNFIGKEALAAVGASFPLIFMLISFIIGITTGATIIISQYYGAKDIEKVKLTIDTIYIFLFFASIAVTVLGIAFSSTIFSWIDLPPDVKPQAVQYLNIFLLGSVFFFGFNGTSSILRGLGDSRTPLYFLVLSTLTNIGLDLLFVLVFKWGIRGVAVSTVLSQGGAFITAILYLNQKHEIVKMAIRKLKFDRDIFRKSVRIGLPSGLQQTFVALGMLALYSIVNKFGTDTIAAYSVAGRIDSFAAIPAMNFSMALSTFVGQNIGAQKPERIRHGFKSTLIMTSIISVSVTIIIVLFGDTIMNMFTTDQNIIKIGHNYLIIVSSFYIVFSGMFVVGGVMRGAGDTLIPMFITLFSLWIIRIPASYYLSTRMGVVGIWWGIPIAWIIGMVFSYIYYKTGRWKNKGVIKYKVAEEVVLPE